MPYSLISPVKDIGVFSVQECMHYIWHSACFLVVLTGEIQVKISGHTTYLNNHGVMLVEPDIPFDIAGHGSNLLLVIRLEYDFFEKCRPDKAGMFVCNSAEDMSRDYRLLRQMLSNLALEYFENIQFKQMRHLELCYSLMYYLNTTHYITNVPALTGEADNKSYIQQFMSYIEKNYMQDIRLEDLAKSKFLSQSYLSRAFKKVTGTNFKSYLEEVRLHHAVEDIRSTDKTITEISYSNGFPNVSALRNALRKKYGLLPHELRKSLDHRETIKDEQIYCNDATYNNIKKNLRDLAGPDPLKSLGKYRLPNQEKYLIEAVEKICPIKPVWKQMINIGTLRSLSNSDAKFHLAMVQNEIGFKYARIESVLSAETMPVLPNGEYNFSQFDRVIKMLLSLNLTPFLDLSYEGDYINMVTARSGTLYSGDNHRYQIEKQQFSGKVSALFRHCINFFGVAEVEKWGVELCATHREDLGYLETSEEFAVRFRFVYNLVKSWLPNMLVGGPEHHIAKDTSFVEEVLKILSKWGIKPDFLSLCAIPYEPTYGTEKSIAFVLSSKRDYIKERIQSIHNMLRSQFPHENIPIWVTVLSPDIRTRNHLNDSVYQATFLIKTTFDLIDLVDVIGYWQLSDIDAEYIDTTRILFGGPGIISKDGLKKASFFALKRLSTINTQLVKKEDDLIVTTNNINTYNVVLYNYAHYTDFYCLSNGEGITYDNVYTIFQDSASKDVSIKLKGLPCGRYKVITTTINRENGSLFDEWLRYGITDGLQPQDISYLSDIVHPHRMVQYHECSDNVLELNLQMLPHEVKFLLIIREL